jgi:Domain of unknown function (DUF5122) beta-propeller
MKSATWWMASTLALVFSLPPLASCVESETYSDLGELTVSVPESFDIRDGGSANLPVTIIRGAGHTKAISLEVVGLPTGLTADPAEIPAGESSGTITLHATGAAIAIDYNVIVNAQSQGVTASDSSLLYVTGKAGTVHTGFVFPAFDSTSRYVGEIPTRAGFLFKSVDFCLVDDRGRDVLTFADGGCIEPGNIFPLATVDVDLHFVFQRDKKILGVSAFKDLQSPNEIDGLILFRMTPEGKLDTTYGPGANDHRSFIRLVGYNPRRVGIGENDEVVVWATNASSGAKMLLRFSPQGEMIASRVLGAEGELGTERSDLIVQADGKVVAAGSNPSRRFITRFNSDFTIDLTFGVSGVVNVGARVPHVIATADGYVAVGQNVALPTLWRFDSLGRGIAGFEGSGVSYPELSNGFFHSVVASQDRLFVSVAGPSHFTVVSLLLDGSRDLSFGVDGNLVLGEATANRTLVDMAPTAHSRANVGFRSTTPTVQYEMTRLWY